MTGREASDAAFMVSLAFLMAGAGLWVASAGVFGRLKRPAPDADVRPGRRPSGRLPVVLLAIGLCFLLVAILAPAR